ncbi:hypothetical protein CCR85_06085 [Rhodothalassium salexigens]|nr:hypothetical protein [Rhodothalassium salexigens]MBK5919489.1 hypothetical protein [Rhodothalassium salexigens]
MSLGLFLAITFALCAAFDLLVPGLSMAAAWQPLLPGVTRLNAWGLLLGLAETFAYGWYAALVFAPLYNRLAARA